MPTNETIAIFASAFGELKTDDIPDSAKYLTDKLFDEAAQILTKTQAVCKQIKNEDLSQLKEEYQEKFKNEKLNETRQELQTIFVKYFQLAEQNEDRIEKRILSHSIPKTKSDNPTEAMKNELRFQEVRNLARNKTLQEKKEMLEDAIQNGNRDIVYAIANSPDPLLPKHLLAQYQRSWAFQQDPQLEKYERECQEISKTLREKAGQLNSTQRMILEDKGFSDPTTKQQHFSTFKPKSEHEQSFANKHIENERHVQGLQSALKDFDQENQQGISL